MKCLFFPITCCPTIHHSNHSDRSDWVRIDRLCREHTIASGRVLDQRTLASREVSSRRAHRGTHTFSSLCVRFAISGTLHLAESVARTLRSHHTLRQWFPRNHARSAHAAQSGACALIQLLHELSGIHTRLRVWCP